MQQCMKIFRRAAGSVALGLLASAAVAPLTRALADFAQDQPSALATPAAPLRQTAPVRLLAALRSKIPVEPVEVDGDPYVIWQSKEPPLPPAGTVCGVRFEPDQVHYRLTTYANTAAARAAVFAYVVRR